MSGGPTYDSHYCPRIKNGHLGECAGSGCDHMTDTVHFDATNSACITDTMDAISADPTYLIPSTNTSLAGVLMMNPTYRPLIIQKRADYCNSRTTEYLQKGTPVNGDVCPSWFVNPDSYGTVDTAITAYCTHYKNIPKPSDGDDYVNYMQICGCFISKDECAESTDVRCSGSAGNAHSDGVIYESAHRMSYQMNRQCPPINVCNSYMNNSGFQVLGAQDQKCITTIGAPQNMMLMFFILFVVLAGIVFGLVRYIKKRTPQYN